MEPLKSHNLYHEYKMLLEMQEIRKKTTFMWLDIEGIPKVYWYGRERNHQILVMELLERSLESFVVNSKVSLSMMSVLLIVE